MPSPGSRIDRFEILELLGAGGMGEVYRAHDTRLQRHVALKFLPDHFVRDAGRLRRFERETQVLASLNHPNVAALFEIVAVPGGHALVLELVEGETLAERISSGALPVPEALGIAAQIATALEAAHEQGIVHRDLKPGNVKLRPDGTVKLLDFGLAKVFAAETVGDTASVTLTALDAADPAGHHVLGSPACMSPEQARGLPIDKRTDIWAFGCLLYEMLCGARAFPGDRAAEVIARILERDPDFAALPAECPQTIQRMLHRCLEKDRRRRLRDIGDARLELLDALSHTAGEPTASGPLFARASFPRAGVRRGLLGALAITALIAGGAIWLAMRASGAPESHPVLRFEIPVPGIQGAGVAISRDGRQIGFVDASGLTVRSLDRLESRVIAPVRIAQGSPFFSPDGQWVGYKGWDALGKLPSSGGETSTLVDRVFAVGTWSGDDILYGDTRGLFRVPAAGGAPVKLRETTGVEQIVSVEALPSKQAVLYTVVPTRGNALGMAGSLPAARIEALNLRTGRSHVVLRGGGRPRLTPTGHLMYVSGGTLYAIPFDSDLLETRGVAVPVIATEGLLDYDVSAEGTLVYLRLSGQRHSTLVWVDRQGNEEPLGAPPMDYLYPRISPDGKRVAIDTNGDDGGRDVWVWDLRRATLALFTKDPAHNPIAAWSPDGRHLVYGSERSGVSNLYRQNADGSGEPEHLIDSDSLQMPISYTPDGKLLVSVGVSGQHRDIHLLDLAGDHALKPLIHTAANELWAEISPDGRWLAYDSDETGQFEVHVRPFPETGAGRRWQISSGGGRQPLWSHDGRELFFRDYSGALLAVAVTAGTEFDVGRPIRIFANADYGGAGSRGSGRTYDVSPDGRRFLMVKYSTPAQAPQLVVVLNWFDELRRLVPIR